MVALNLPDSKDAWNYCRLDCYGSTSIHFGMRMLEVEPGRCSYCLHSNCRCMDMEAVVVDVADVAGDSNNFGVLVVLVVGWDVVVAAAGAGLESVEKAKLFPFAAAENCFLGPDFHSERPSCHRE